MFQSSAFEAAICSVIEPNCAKPNGAVSLPNPSAVRCWELEQIAGLSWLRNKPRRSYLTHYTWKAASLKATCTCVLLHLSAGRNGSLSWPRLPLLVMLFCKLAVALTKLHLASPSDIRRHLGSVQVLKYKR